MHGYKPGPEGLRWKAHLHFPQSSGSPARSRPEEPWRDELPRRASTRADQQAGVHANVAGGRFLRMHPYLDAPRRWEVSAVAAAGAQIRSSRDADRRMKKDMFPRNPGLEELPSNCADCAGYGLLNPGRPTSPRKVQVDRPACLRQSTRQVAGVIYTDFEGSIRVLAVAHDHLSSSLLRTGASWPATAPGCVGLHRWLTYGLHFNV